MTNKLVYGKEILEQLSKPFEDKDICWRVQNTSRDGKKVLMLPYIDSRAVMNRLDEVLGLNWSDEYSEVNIDGEKAMQCRLTINVDGKDIVRTDGASLTDVESIKGGYSDALKRAAVKFGIGRSIYEAKDAWCDILQSGKQYIRYKVNNQYQSGYVNPPPIKSLLPSTPNSQQQQRPPQQQQQQRPPQQGQQMPQQPLNEHLINPPQQQQQQRPQERANGFQVPQQNANTPNQNQNAFTLIEKELLKANVGTGLIPALFNTQDLSTVPDALIAKVFKNLKAVNGYLAFARENKVPKDQLFSCAQIAFKQPVTGIEQLFFMDESTTLEALAFLKESINENLPF